MVFDICLVLGLVFGAIVLAGIMEGLLSLVYHHSPKFRQYLEEKYGYENYEEDE